jgi:hypothetical protein
MDQDEEHLKLLAIFHYIVGALAALFSLFALMYVGLGLLMVYVPQSPQAQGEPPPPWLGWIFVAMGGFAFLAGETLATCICLAGRFIAKRRRYWFAFITACVECLFFPFGIILGIFTIIVLSKASVKKLFDVAPHARGNQSSI